MKNTNRSFSASVLIFVSFAVAIHVNFVVNYVPSEQILLNCGESLILNDTDTQSWTLDVKPKFLLSAKSLTSKATTQDPLVPKVPFMTARVSHSEFSYSFPVVTGLDGETLTIKFTPSTNSLNSYAFVNGIEVMSMPDDIYKNDDGTLKLVGQDSLIYINTTALENVYCINVGGNDISPSSDSVILVRLGLGIMINHIFMDKHLGYL
ncbi:hypothetical protein Q3G72_002741 [Acer saccharum]|nr:hypothetical protein Q3G72_002741 [Acer saccharum]